uniref:Ubiquitin-protein ligase/ zinc ion binding protein n=1 Tax=Zea mays TaxID=4577 RepID=B6TFQ4_MAIZE|nr:ubiquitin-protein ligase/ zinc ion binding protein [Zea mays]
MTGKKTTASSSRGTPKKAKIEDEEEAGLENEEEATVTLSVEKDALECDICCLPFQSEVFMCKNGHSGCAKCCIRRDGKCWTCSERIGDMRCRPLEKLLAAATTSCVFKSNGCYDAVSYLERATHEETCQRAPYKCPIDGCAYSGLRLGHHVAQDHGRRDGLASIVFISGKAVATVRKDEPFRVLLQRNTERVFLLLNGHDLLQGRSLSLLCLGPRFQDGVEVEPRYKMEVSHGALTLSASGTIQFARRLDGFQAEGFLFVPDAYWGSAGSIAVTVRIYF